MFRMSLVGTTKNVEITVLFCLFCPDGDCLEGKGENYQVCSVQYYVQQCAQSNAHTYEQT